MSYDKKEILESIFETMRKFKVTDLQIDGMTIKMSPIGFQEDVDKQLQAVVKKFEEKSGMSKEEFDSILFHSAN